MKREATSVSQFLGANLMTRRFLGLLLTTLLLVVVSTVQAQQPKKVPRLGYLSGSDSMGAARGVEAFRQGRQDLGYIEGRDILIEYRYA
jgi:putative tryptophan/tyrosine transport system substrate-binding protein